MPPKKTPNRRRVLLKLIAAACLVGMLYLGYIAIREDNQHRQLEHSVDSLANSLREHGFSGVTKSSGCGRPYVELGRAGKSCSIALSVRIESADAQSAYQSLRKYTNAIAATYKFTPKSTIPSSIVDADNLTFGYITYRENDTDKVCTVDYDYNAKSKSVEIGLSCDDNSWFTRNLSF